MGISYKYLYLRFYSLSPFPFLLSSLFPFLLALASNNNQFFFPMMVVVAVAVCLPR